METPTSPSTHTTLLLAIGAAAGLVVALAGLVRDAREPALPIDAAARINATIISNEAYARALKRFGDDSADPLSDEDATWVLDRLIQEELLVQRGLELGLPRSSSSVRNAIVAAMIESIVTESRATEISEAELRDWFAENRLLFTAQSAYRVVAYSFASEEQAQQAIISAEGRAPASGHRLEVPETDLPLTKLRDYLGETAVSRLAKLGAAESTEPFAFNGRWLKILVIAQTPGRQLDFDSEINKIESEWRRRTADRALRDYLARLRRDASVNARPALHR